MDQRLTKLIGYFRNYSYTAQSPSHDSQSQLIIELDQCILNARTLIDLYQQKVTLLEVENQSLHQDNQQLRFALNEDTLDTEKLLQRQIALAQQLRKQLIQKDQDNRLLADKIEQLEIAQADQLNSIKNQQSEDASIFQHQIHQQKIHYQHLLSTLQQQLHTQISSNSQLQTNIAQLQSKIAQLSHQLELTLEDNTKLQSFIQQPHQQQFNPDLLSSHKKYRPFEDFQPTITEPFLPHLEIIYSHESDPINASQDEILNYSYEERPTALKDVLNFSGCNSSRFNVNEFLRSKEKENIGENVPINGTNSSKKIYMLSQKRKLRMSSNSKHNSSSNNNNQTHDDEQNHHRIQQFTTTANNSPQNVDPYYVFFALTAQCIKINSEYFEEIAQIDIVDQEWDHVIRERIPMNLWANHLERVLIEKVCS